ncbi:DUF2470 domain-containing protein [Aquibium sp. A9E412]|uniref:HugZ family pyridoxamine 5'-phosphate oxidase n=1 Tax=Aquibium sp. A9E412 TaxID=2976767 RepID=UPI0025AF2E25|nr:DUF2470 domain-containing protein [Aquibium sp. A9E412]MDN2567805.1 DUF2470 domain-containing protein [Aquibium sp. A9E412]
MAEEPKSVIRPTDAEAVRLAKTLLRAARYGALAVLDPADGAPLASRVACATEPDGAPVILVSALSAHTPALLADPRCSLLLGEPGRGDPLAHPRITVACRAARLERGSAAHARAARRYLARHPKARLYADFGDFAFVRLEPQGASLNGGFGRAYRLARGELMTDGPALAALEAIEADAVAHMNADHADAVALCARHFAGARGDGWTMTGLDPEGFDVARGDAAARIFFPEPLADADALRPVLVAMTRAAREAEA